MYILRGIYLCMRSCVPYRGKRLALYWGSSRHRPDEVGVLPEGQALRCGVYFFIECVLLCSCLYGILYEKVLVVYIFTSIAAVPNLPSVVVVSYKLAVLHFVFSLYLRKHPPSCFFA